MQVELKKQKLLNKMKKREMEMAIQRQQRKHEFRNQEIAEKIAQEEVGQLRVVARVRRAWLTVQLLCGVCVGSESTAQTRPVPNVTNQEKDSDRTAQGEERDEASNGTNGGQ